MCRLEWLENERMLRMPTSPLGVGDHFQRQPYPKRQVNEWPNEYIHTWRHGVNIYIHIEQMHMLYIRTNMQHYFLKTPKSVHGRHFMVDKTMYVYIYIIRIIYCLVFIVGGSMLQFYMTFEVCVSQFFLAGIRSSLPQTWESYIDFTLDRRRSLGLRTHLSPTFKFMFSPIFHIFCYSPIRFFHQPIKTRATTGGLLPTRVGRK